MELCVVHFICHQQSNHDNIIIKNHCKTISSTDSISAGTSQISSRNIISETYRTFNISGFCSSFVISISKIWCELIPLSFVIKYVWFICLSPKKNNYLAIIYHSRQNIPWEISYTTQYYMVHDFPHTENPQIVIIFQMLC